MQGGAGLTPIALDTRLAFTGSFVGVNESTLRSAWHSSRVVRARIVLYSSPRDHPAAPSN